MAVLEQPAGGLGDEDEAEGHEDGHDENEAQGDEVGFARRDLGGEVVDDGADEAPDGRPDLERADHQASVPCWRGFLVIS